MSFEGHICMQVFLWGTYLQMELLSLFCQLQYLVTIFHKLLFLCSLFCIFLSLPDFSVDIIY